MEQSKNGIYLDKKELKVLRCNSPYYYPSGPDWVYLTPEVNATLLKIRELAKEKKLVSTPDAIVWGDFPTVS